MQRGTVRIDYPLHLTFREISKDESFKIPGDRKNIALDLDLLNFPLRLRRWKKGDFFYPLGMTNRKKLSDYFTNQKINRLEKEKIWLLTTDNEIVWIIAYQIDNRFKITSGTKRILLVSLNT
ncbi:hypothetical protein ES705_27135 [subsurface metagenome]